MEKSLELDGLEQENWAQYYIIKHCTSYQGPEFRHQVSFSHFSSRRSSRPRGSTWSSWTLALKQYNLSDSNVKKTDKLGFCQCYKQLAALNDQHKTWSNSPYKVIVVGNCIPTSLVKFLEVTFANNMWENIPQETCTYKKHFIGIAIVFQN